MKCCLKDGFINILLLICITPTKGIELFLRKTSVLDKPMNLQQFRTSINRLQDLDSFPDNGDNQLHRIVKKQMATCDYRDGRRGKRSAVGFPGRPSGFRGGAGDAADVKCQDDETAENADKDLEVLKSRSTDSTDSTGSFLRKLKNFVREKDLLFIKRTKGGEFLKNRDPIKEEAVRKGKNEEDMLRRLKETLKGKDDLKENKNPVDEENPKGNRCLTKHFERIPDRHDYRCYYECESRPNGCLKLRHKHCPRGQFFSFKYLKCLKPPKCRHKKSFESIWPKLGIPKNGLEDPEPANEWLDAKEPKQKIPYEFQSKKKPGLKFYHLRPKRKLDGLLGGEVVENRHPWPASHVGAHQQVENAIHRRVKKHGTRHHLPRSYVIRVNKKEDDQVAENDENENDNDEEDDETDEEDEDEEADDEDDDGEDEDAKEVTEEKHQRRESIRDLLKSAKEAVTNRARFEDPIEMAMSSSSSKASSAPSKTTSSCKSKKSSESTEKEKKKVLIDANIKVDSTIGSVLKSFLKSKRKDKDAANGLTDDYDKLAGLRTPDRTDPEGAALYEHLMRNNPRVKRYYLANCAGGGN